MHVISIDQAREKAKDFQQDGESWHFHVLNPGCVFNSNAQKYAFVLEGCSSNQTYIIHSDEGFPELSQELLKLHYGDAILEDSGSEKPQIVRASNLLDQFEKLKKENIPWHHHMLFPECIFNRHPGMWVVVLESKASALVINELYEEEPLDLLRQLEIGYFNGSLPDFKV